MAEDASFGSRWPLAAGRRPITAGQQAETQLELGPEALVRVKDVDLH